jgi:DNA repair exonuclease SbcCD ATPase subunit
MSEENKLTTEIEILAETIEARTGEFNSAFEKIKKELETELENLKKYNVMLQSVPAKVAKQIEETIPKIALELDAINGKKMEELKKQYANIEQEHHNSLMQTENKIKEILQDIYKIERRRIFRFLLVVVTATGVASGIAAYTAKYVTDAFLRRVMIDKPNQVILQDSDVMVIDTSNDKIYKQSAKKKK